jgi:hypothetical protein
MNVLGLLGADHAAGAAAKAVRAFVTQLLSADPSGAAALATGDLVLLGQSGPHDWPRVGAAFSSLGAVKVEAAGTAPASALRALPEAERSSLLGEVAGDDLVLIANLSAPSREVVSIGFVLDQSRPRDPKVRRVFDPIPFAELVGALGE